VARSSTLESELGGLPSAIKTRLMSAFRYVLDQGLRLGRPDDRGKSENFACHFYTATTPSIAGTEFTISHGLGKTPYLLVPVLAVETNGASVGPLTVTRSADDYRVYLSSTLTDATICVMLEA
jgi:hypothetical protein